MNKNTFKGYFTNIIKDFIEEKIAIGLKYTTQSNVLKEFDKFTIAENFIGTLTKELVEKWISKRPNENLQNQRKRMWTIRQLALYMNRNGYKVYIPPREIYRTLKSNYIPYIFSKDEIRNIFKKSENMKFQKTSPHKHLVIPLLFKILYGCGLRITETLNLRLKDVDTNNGILMIRYAKFNHHRIVAMGNSLNKRCIDYIKIVHLKSNLNSVFLANPNKKVYTAGIMYKEFRKVLWKAGISHGGRGKGPRVHDLRHTFAVHCLQNWVKDGVDIMALLPILSAYLGHSGLYATQQYLRLTAEVFPEIVDTVEKKFGYCIPRLTGGEDFNAY